MARWIGTAAIVWWLVAGAVPAQAQTTIYRFKRGDSGCASPCAGLLQAIDPDRPAILWSAPIPATSNASMGAYVTRDGRYLLWTEPNLQSRQIEALVLYDIPARSASRIPWSQPLLGNPRRTEVYLNDAAGPLALSFQGARRLTGTECHSSSPVEVSGDGSRVAYRCNRLGGDALVVFDLESGALEALFDQTGLGFFGATLGRDGRDLYVTSAGRLRRIALASGQAMADVLLPTQFNGWPETALGVAVDPRTGVVYAFGEGIYRFDPVTLQLVSSTAAPWAPKVRGPLGPPNPGLRWIQFDPYRPRIYASSNDTPVHDWVLTEDAQVLVDAVQPYSPYADTGVLLVAPRPTAPVAVAAVVQGANVTVSWTPGQSVAVTTRHVLEVGAAPGRTDLLTLESGPGTTLAFAGVPSGTYYVRVRAGNYTGLGAASNEVVVTVP